MVVSSEIFGLIAPGERDSFLVAKCRKGETYTSTGVRAPWVTEQQTAPAKANLE